MYIFLICLVIDTGIYIVSQPPLLVTSIIREVFGVSGMIAFSAAIWWLLTLVGLGAMLRLKSRLGSAIVLMASFALWLLNILSPLGSMTIALEYPNLVWGVLELFYVLILVCVEIMVFKK